MDSLGPPAAEGAQPLHPLEVEAIRFEPRGDLAARATLFGLVMTLLSVLLMAADWAEGIWDEVMGLFALVYFGTTAAIHAIYLLRGKRYGGMLIDSEGIILRTSPFRLPRIHWHEVEAIYAVDQTSTRVYGKDPFTIGLDFTEDFVRRRPTWGRFNLWLNRRLSLGPDLRISSMSLQASRDEILSALQDGLERFELRAISEAKRLKGDPEGS